MAIGISREAHFGLGGKSFRFEVHRDVVADQKLYEAGRELEAARFRNGSLAQRIFDRLSSTEIKPSRAACDKE